MIASARFAWLQPRRGAEGLRWGAFLLACCLSVAALAQDAPTTATESYRIAPGDRLGVAISFAPAQVEGRQKIAPGDRLGLIYHIDIPPVDAAYRVEPGDQLNIQFEFAPEIRTVDSRNDERPQPLVPPPYIIQPDGTVGLAGIKQPLRVAGKTVEEIRVMVEAAYKDILTIPDAVVSIERRGDLKHNTIRQLFQPEEKRPLSYLTLPVPDDGRLSLPLIPVVRAAGMTVDDLGTSVTRTYHRLGYPLLTVNVFYDAVADRRHEQLRALLGERVHPLSMEVLPTGELTLPLLAPVAVADKPVVRVNRELTDAYRKRGFDRVEVSIWVERTARADR